MFHRDTFFLGRPFFLRSPRSAISIKHQPGLALAADHSILSKYEPWFAFAGDLAGVYLSFQTAFTRSLPTAKAPGFSERSSTF